MPLDRETFDEGKVSAKPVNNSVREVYPNVIARSKSIKAIVSAFPNKDFY